MPVLPTPSSPSPALAHRALAPVYPGLRRLFLLAIVLGMVLSACADSGVGHEQDSTATTTAVPVRVAPVQLSEEQAWLRFASISRSRQRAALTFQVEGVVQQRFVEIGQAVQAGQPLMELYNPRLAPAAEAARHRLAQLQADWLQAQNEVARLETLFQRGVIPRQELEQQLSRASALAAAVENAAASLEQAQQLLAETRLQAPFAGMIEAILVEPGEYTQPGQPVMRIASDNRMETEIRVPGHLTTHLQIGQQLPVWSSLAAGEPATGTIIEIARSNTAGSALYPVILTLDNTAASAGEALEVGVPQHQSPALMVPLGAIMRSADGLTVFRVNNNHAERVRVEVELLQGELAAIKPGPLSEGQVLVYAGLTRLADGDLVEVLP